ncbi:chymotrypsin-like [Schistocerca americana]|uniref:chymotrypsin-like n=1 Tax=Schistocerca americana TaxID=7009 RepID=UPI001F4F83A9|nr:chymotrypsin-like [Schistocerca americana]
MEEVVQQPEEEDVEEAAQVATVSAMAREEAAKHGEHDHLPLPDNPRAPKLVMDMLAESLQTYLYLYHPYPFTPPDVPKPPLPYQPYDFGWAAANLHNVVSKKDLALINSHPIFTLWDWFSKWWVYLGVEDLSTSDDYAAIFDCYTIQVHPGYDSTTKVHDIGLIYSASLIPFNQYIKPAVLPRYSDVDSSLEGSENTVCGWGSQTTGGAGSQTLWYAYFDSVTLCSPAWSYCGVGRYGEALCSGDFGTSMQRKEADGNFTVVGVASFIQGTTTCEGATSGFTMVAAYLDWLARHTRLPVYP